MKKDLKSCMINTRKEREREGERKEKGSKEKKEEGTTSDRLSNKEIQSNSLRHLWLYFLKTT